MKLNKLPVIILAILVISSGDRITAMSDELLVVGNFSNTHVGDRLPSGWEPLRFQMIPQQTQYTLVSDSGMTVIRAISQASASGLTRKISINPKDYPIIQWRWKISNIYHKGDVTHQKGDDYPARLYVTFAYNPDESEVLEKTRYAFARLFYGAYPPGGAINYIWASNSPVGTIVPNPYTDRSRMIVLESGDSRSNQWIQEERNVYADYQKVFGTEPPLIAGVAIMTDSDNTGESATAFYGDIIFRKK
jgi:hypothetical protein